MLIDSFLNVDAFPALERSMQFAARRQDIIAHNISNISTPNFQQADVSVGAFQASLRDAIDQRRAHSGGVTGELDLKPTREVSFTPTGALALTPTTFGQGVLFHDRNNRDLERLMQDLVENLTAYRVAGDLLRNRMQTLRSAINGRL